MLSNLAMGPRRLVVVGVPDSRRVRQLVEAAKPWCLSPPLVISYRDAMRGDQVPPPHSLVRLESPSDCPETLKVILEAGIEPMRAEGLVPVSDGELCQLDPSRGEILHPRQWFLGFCRVLKHLESQWRSLSPEWMSTPDSIITCFDKTACLQLWENIGLAVPSRLNWTPTYAAIRQNVTDRHARLFIKLRYGYSAMGAVALEWRGNLVRAITCVEATWAAGRPRLFVTKRPHVLNREFEIAWLIDTLAMEEIIVEQWIPKARWEGVPYDLRLIMIGGSLHHVVGRANSSPFTNLNLGAKRIAREDVLAELGSQWTILQTLAEQAAKQIPSAGMLGLDVIVRPRNQGFVLLEANAFGDYLPGLLHHGESTYTTQFRKAYGNAMGGDR